jgi:hypothetical protein
MTDILERAEPFCRINEMSADGDANACFTASELEAFLTSEKRELEEKLAMLKAAVQENHEWHELMDEYNGYLDSHLYSMNHAALVATSQSVEAFLNGVKAEAFGKGWRTAANWTNRDDLMQTLAALLTLQIWPKNSRRERNEHE